jgi:hypothetical protein
LVGLISIFKTLGGPRSKKKKFGNTRISKKKRYFFADAGLEWKFGVKNFHFSFVRSKRFKSKTALFASPAP